MTTTLRIRAIPYGAALQLTRRALALGPDRFTHRGVLELMAQWWEAGAAGWDATNRLGILVAAGHPFTFALRILETLP